MLNLKKKRFTRELANIFNDVSVADSHGNVFVVENGKVLTKKATDKLELDSILSKINEWQNKSELQCYDDGFKQFFSKVILLGKEPVVVAFSTTTKDAVGNNLSKNNVVKFVMEHDKRLYTDSLTGVYNKLYLSNSFDDKRISAVAMVDVDDFKKINDNYGHLMGDKILKDIASVLSDSAAEYGKVVRFGGDEFVIVFENVDKTILQKIVRKINENIAKIEIDNFSTIVSVSIGAVYGTGKLNNFIDKADKVMYQLKKNKK